MADFGTSLDRRRFLKLCAAASAVTALPLATRPAQAKASAVYWLTWENLAKAEYLAPYLAAGGVPITKGFIGSDDEQFAKLRAGGGSEWDLITPGIDKAELYIASNLLQPLDLSKIPNAAHLYAPFKTSPLGKKDGKTYNIPFYWGINPIVYRADLMDKEPDWSTLFEGEKYKGRLAMRDYALEGIVISALYVGIPRDKLFKMGAKELAECKKALLAQKKLLRTYWNSIGDLTNLFASGEVVCAFSWVPPYYDLKARGLNMGMAKPKQGVIGWCDSLAIPAQSKPEGVEAAHALINYLLGPEYGKLLAVGGPYAQSTDIARSSLTDEQQERIFVKDLGVMDSFVWKENPANYGDWVRLWNEVKAS